MTHRQSAAPSTSKAAALWLPLIERARFDPVWFARDVLQLKQLPGEPALADSPMDSWELDGWQVELLEACGDVVRKHYGRPTVVNHEALNLISCVAMQGPGKTFALAIVLHWFAFAFRAVIPCTAPKLEHLKTRLWKEFRKIAYRAAPGYSLLMHVDTTKITWAGDPDWFATAETASQPESMQGLRGPYTLVLGDEASGIPEPMFPVIMGNLAATRIGILLTVGNPTRNVGTFADMHRKAERARDVYRIKVGPRNTLRFKQSWIDQMVRQYGINSPAVQIRCFGEFAESDRDQLIPLAWLANAFDRESFADGSLPKLRISIDVADGGEDETIATVARHWASGIDLLRQKAYNFPPSRSPIMAADAAIELFEAFGGRVDEDDFVVDSIGVGAGTAGYLMEKGYRVVTYKGGEASDDTLKWRNRRVQSYLVARNALRDARVSIADNFLETAEELAEFEAQMASVRRKPGAERVEDLETKEDMRRRGLKSPDRADSVIMQFATQRPTLARGTRIGFDIIESTVLEAL